MTKISSSVLFAMLTRFAYQYGKKMQKIDILSFALILPNRPWHWRPGCSPISHSDAATDNLSVPLPCLAQALPSAIGSLQTLTFTAGVTCQLGLLSAISYERFHCVTYPFRTTSKQARRLRIELGESTYATPRSLAAPRSPVRLKHQPKGQEAQNKAR